ncbi:MAG TPA: hypothetical protein VMT79_10380 [Candidatus Binatia bacterium]|nr:hypothetical protein [Candidatus Binatia bacterium]
MREGSISGTLMGMSVDGVPDLLPVAGHRHPLWMRVLCFVGGLVFVVLGVVGWLIPVVTGLPFYAVALVLFAMASDRARSWVNALDRRLPLRVRVAIRDWLGRRSPRVRRFIGLEEDPAGGG